MNTIYESQGPLLYTLEASDQENQYATYYEDYPQPSFWMGGASGSSAGFMPSHSPYRLDNFGLDDFELQIPTPNSFLSQHHSFHGLDCISPSVIDEPAKVSPSVPEPSEPSRYHEPVRIRIDAADPEEDSGLETRLRHQLGLRKGDALSLASLPDPGKSHKPAPRYALLVQLAIISSRDKRLTLKELCAVLEARFAYFRVHSGSTAKWKQSIRHMLSLRKEFRKVTREIDSVGRGHYWECTNEVGTKRPRHRARGERSSDQAVPPGPSRSLRSRRHPFQSPTEDSDGSEEAGVDLEDPDI